MTYFNKLQTLALYYPFQVLLVTLILFLFLLSKKLYFYKNMVEDYKIYHPRVNIIAVGLYGILFVGLIVYLRYLRLGFTLELLPFFKKWFNFYLQVPLLFFIILLQILVIGIIILFKVKQILGRELWKRHLYFYFTSYNSTIKKLLEQKINPLTIAIQSKHSVYNRIVDKLSQYWSYERVISRIQWRCFVKPYCKITHSSKTPWLLNASTSVFLKYWIYFLAIYLIYYDLRYNHYCLHLVFYYLPLYLLYSLWKTVSNILSNTNKDFNFIIFERYYEMSNVLYVNTTDEEETILLTYIKRGFRSYLKDLHPINNKTEWDMFANFPTLFKQQRRFVKNDAGEFINASTSSYFHENSIKIEHENY